MIRAANKAAFALAIGMAALGAGPVQAQDTPDHCRVAAIDWDGNATNRAGTGTIDEISFRKFGDRAFRAWDQDGDGRLSRSEFATCFGRGEVFREQRDGLSGPVLNSGPVAGNVALLFPKWDKNGDGHLSASEFLRENTFAEIDRNGDRKLTARELYAAM